MIQRISTLYFFLLFNSISLQAQNFLITSTNDTQDLILGDGICDDGTGNCSLRAAIMESNSI